MELSTLKEILKQEVSLYATDGANAVSFLTVSEDENVFVVVDIAEFVGRRVVGATLMARIETDKIHIEIDRNSKPLVDALLGRNVPIEQIVLRYKSTN